jgi:hypothetical protein
MQLSHRVPFSLNPLDRIGLSVGDARFAGAIEEVQGAELDTAAGRLRPNGAHRPAPHRPTRPHGHLRARGSWQLAEHVGHGSAYRLEWLLNGAKWHADALRDRVREYVVATLGAEDGVLIADDTQVIKKGAKSVGVAQQHCGATGRPRTVR